MRTLSSSRQTEECHVPVSFAIKITPKNTTITAEMKTSGLNALLFGMAASNASLTGQWLTHVRHPVHSGECMASFLSTGKREGQFFVHNPH